MSDIALKVIPKFPSQVIGIDGIDVMKTNGNWTVAIDYTQFALRSPYTPQPGHYVLVYDSLQNTYFLAPATSF